MIILIKKIFIKELETLNMFNSLLWYQNYNAKKMCKIFTIIIMSKNIKRIYYLILKLQNWKRKTI